MKNIPPAPKGVPRIEVTFDIDSNGILKVTATESSSGQKADIEVVNNKSIDCLGVTIDSRPLDRRYDQQNHR